MWSQSFFWQFVERWPSLEQQQKKRPRRQGKSKASSSGSEKATQRSSHTNNAPTAKPSKPASNWWNQQRTAFGNACAGIGASFERIRPKGLQVNVDVDMVRPAVEAVSTSVKENWMKMPPQVRSAVRYFGAAFLSGWLVNRINQRTILKEREINGELRTKIIELNSANEALMARPYSVLGEGVSDYVRTMSEAIAQTTNAAARATEAAATASEACAIRTQKGIRPVRGRD